MPVPPVPVPRLVMIVPAVMPGPEIARPGNSLPLVKSASKEAFRKNVAAEVKSGKPVKQAVAISYAVKRAAAKTSSKGKK